MRARSRKPIAVRELSLKNKKKKIKVEIFAPHRSQDGLYRCEFRIEGAPEGLSELHVAGIDSYQALTLTFKAVAGAIEAFNRECCASKLQWMDGEDLNFQFSTKLGGETKKKSGPRKKSKAGAE